ADMALVSPFADVLAPPDLPAGSNSGLHLLPIAREPAVAPPADPWGLWDWPARSGSSQERGRNTADASTAEPLSRQQADDFFSQGAAGAADLLSDPLAGPDGNAAKTPTQPADSGGAGGGGGGGGGSASSDNSGSAISAPGS